MEVKMIEGAQVKKKTEYLIGDVAQMVGLSRDALRFYEKKGVINARKKDNGYRYYSEEDIYKLMYIPVSYTHLRTATVLLWARAQVL